MTNNDTIAAVSDFLTDNEATLESIGEALSVASERVRVAISPLLQIGEIKSYRQDGKTYFYKHDK